MGKASIPKEDQVVRKLAKDVISEVCDRHGLTVAQMIGPSRRRKYAHPRHEAIFQTYLECPHLSYPAIARAFGGRDHTTAIYAVQIHCKRNGLDYESVKRRTDIYRFPVHHHEPLLFMPVTASDYREAARL